MEALNIDLKKTVLLPKTDFPMKANLTQLEPRLLARWKQEKLYERIRQARAGRPRYVLHDGPPYANGNIHLGTAFNKILKDLVVKLKTMGGFDSPYVPGWDCHGLPIEIKVDNELGKKKASMSAAQIRAACRAYAQKFVDLHVVEFQRLGVFGQFDKPYLTMAPEFEAVTAQAFVDVLDRGYVYKGLKPVNWCIQDRTALAEAEVEYETHTSPSIFVRFALKSDPDAIHHSLARHNLAGRKVYGLIWTTTPWTLPANMAIAFHPKFEYLAVEAGDAVYIVAGGLLNSVSEQLGWTDPKIIDRFTGDRLERVVFRHPFIDRDSLGILADHVTLEQGTGAVHTAPGHGHEDYVVGMQYGIPTYCPVDAAGRFFHVEDAQGRLPEELIGKSVWEANPIVTGLLGSELLAQQKVEHSYPHCWRCHKPTIYRATDQWFIGMERNGLRERTLEAIRGVHWMPAWGEDRISNMIASRPDWCISRQRVWGVPIVVFYCNQCREPLTDTAVLTRVVSLFRQHSTDIWYEWPASKLLEDSVACSKCGGRDFSKETDILDVWFDSGSTHLAVLTPENDLPWPADLYLEGGDQYRGWFHSSLLEGVALKGGSPYRESLTHGWTLDEQGRAMSKSLGNTIEPDQIIKKYGAEVLRLWVASVEFTEDVRLSDTMLTRLSEAYRKLRNTFRYSLGNLHDFDPARDALPVSELREVDQWILARTADLVRRTTDWYAEFALHKVYHAAYAFATVDLSAIYFDVLKDRLYTAARRSHARRSAQTALYRIHHALVRLLAPILTFTSEEAWGYTRKLSGDPDSVHLALFPDPQELTGDLDDARLARLGNWDRLMEAREVVLGALEEARQAKTIGAPLEAAVTLSASGELLELLRHYESELPALFITSQAHVAAGDGELRVEVRKAAGQKCERCWKYTTDVGSRPEFPTACAACAEAVIAMSAEPDENGR